MKFEELMNNLSEEAKQKLAECKTQEEVKKILAEAGVEPLDDKLLDEVAGGVSGGRQTPLPTPGGLSVLI